MNEILNRTQRVVRSFYKRPPIGMIRFGSLRRVTPISRVFGYDRGNQSIARYYIDNFIAKSSDDIKGHVLEIGDDSYTKRFRKNKVKISDVLHAQPGNSTATIIADLTCATNIPGETFDCIILTQTLQFIYDVNLALHHVFRILRPGGIILVTLSGISQISRYDMDRWGEYWRFTTASAEKLFYGYFSSDNLKIESYGNVLAAISLLHGISSSELKQSELDFMDPDYQIIISVRAVKPL